MRQGRINQLLNSVADAGRELLRRGAPAVRLQPRPIDALCRELLSTRGEASGTALARDVDEAYRAMDDDEKLRFFRMLEAEFGADAEKVVARAEAYRKQRDLTALLALGAAVEAPRQELIRRINMAPDGTRTIVAMRRDLLTVLPDHPELKAVDVDLKHLLASWFNRGFLYLEEIDWHSSAAVLEKIMAYEAVHRMEGWDDLRRRLAEDRRCFAFFHPALPDEPVIFVEVALLRGMAGAIRPLLERNGDTVDPAEADTAIFYSINNCQDGLRGISFGNFLIKQVVLELARDLPAVKTFATLSPIPGFCAWLANFSNGASNEIAADDAETLKVLKRVGWERDQSVANALKPTLLRQCARYLLEAKENGEPLDPVARFHLRNGARLERINWLGDTSPKGIQQSAGLLVNYLYDPKTIERNHEDYVKNGKVVASSEVTRLVK